MRVVLSLFLALLATVAASADTENSNESGHTNNWAVLVSTSRFWFNYRHMANVLGFYRNIKRLGIPDSQIIVMLSDDVACNPRNPYVGSVFKGHEHDVDVYGSNIEVDYRGYEVTVENFIRLLTDRWDEDVPRSKRLMSDDRSNVLVYLTGHGGDDFLKFQDAEEIGAWDLANAFGQMWEKRRYRELLFMIDTCEASSMYSKMYSPNMISVASSQHEPSLANSTDPTVGVALIDRFSNFQIQYLEEVDINSELTLADMFASYDPVDIESHPGIRDDLFKRPLSSVRVTDFFGNIQGAAVDEPEVSLQLDTRIYQDKYWKFPEETKNSGADANTEDVSTTTNTPGDAAASGSTGANSSPKENDKATDKLPKIVCVLGVLGALFLGSKL